MPVTLSSAAVRTSSGSMLARILAGKAERSIDGAGKPVSSTALISFDW
jgi:hypothetical protein